DEGPQHGGRHEAAVGQFLDRGLREELEEQCRQREIDGEDVQPCEGILVLAPEPAAEKAKGDQAEERKCQAGDLEHLKTKGDGKRAGSAKTATCCPTAGLATKRQPV